MPAPRAVNSPSEKVKVKSEDVYANLMLTSYFFTITSYLNNVFPYKKMSVFFNNKSVRESTIYY